MRILHYSLGFPPYRTGGLVKFCMDLMKEQVKEGHDVSLLWPGKIEIFGKKTKIREHDRVDGIRSFEVINPTPVSYDEGIKDFEAFMRPGNADAYEGLLDRVKPDVIHIHTFMGLHMAFLEVAKRKGIRLIFTTHDFFPICPKVTMFRHGKICDSIDSCQECGACNHTALSLNKIQILQSPLYRRLKDAKAVKALRKQHRDEYLGDDESRAENGSVGTAADYKNLRAYYQEMLSRMDIIHYNSSVTKKVYEGVFGIYRNQVINITHADISDHRTIRNYGNQVLRIRYLGTQSGAKGYFFLKSVLDSLNSEGIRFQLDIHFQPNKHEDYICEHNRYSYDDLKTIFDDTDILICPSIWYETFGLTVLEALSYAVPVIVNHTVGAIDIIPPGGGIIFHSKEDLIDKLNTLDNEKLRRMNRILTENEAPKRISVFANEILELYTKPAHGES